MKTQIIFRLFFVIVWMFFFFFSCQEVERKEETEQQNVIKTSYTSQADAKDTDLKAAIIKIIKAFQNRDENTLNSLIYKDFAFTVIYCQGIYPNLVSIPKISFDNPVPDFLGSSYDSDIATEDKVDYTLNLIKFEGSDANKNRWKKRPGIYIDTQYRDNFLSSKAKLFNESFGGDMWSLKEIAAFEEIEKHSCKVVLIDNDLESFTFYVAQMGKEWYLTAIDRCRELEGESDEGDTFELIKNETINELRLGLSKNQVIKILGNPAKLSKKQISQVDGAYHQTYYYTHLGIELGMVDDNEEEQIVDMIFIQKPCKFKTSRNIAIGSSYSEVEQAYADYYVKEYSSPEEILAGSIYGGVIFKFEKGKVISIFVGAAAE